jgi:hypothetical protein
MPEPNMSIQDDAREFQMVQLFNLTVAEERGRSDIDAVLSYQGHQLPFELKSTTGRSISTVRDFGRGHIEKWRELHWLFGFYEPNGTRLRWCHYASPHDMRPWIDGRAAYVGPDLVLAEHVPELIGLGTLHRILGEKRVYTLEDAQSVHKQQYTAARYREAMDLDEGYSPERMLAIVRDRCRYVLERGLTLNNPKIPGSYFDGFERIEQNHAIRLRQLVTDWLAAHNDPSRAADQGV